MESRAGITSHELADAAQRLAEEISALNPTAEEATENLMAALEALYEAERESPPREDFPHPPRSLLPARPAPPRTIRPTARAHLKQHDRKRGDAQ